jgi:hypothetical protein
MIGVYAKEPANATLFARYKGLLEFSWVQNIKTCDYFTPAVGAMRREIFEDIGGFDKRYRHMEENVLGYKIIEKCPIIIRNDIQVYHHFPVFRKCAKLYFKRCFVWMRLFLERKKFDNSGTTQSAGFGAIAAFLTIFFIPFAFLGNYFLFLPLACFLIFIILNLKLFWFVMKNSNFLFLFYFVLTNFFLMFVVGFAAIFSVITVPFFDINAGWLK